MRCPLLLLLSITCLAYNTHAEVTIDFEALAQPGTTEFLVGPTYVENGFVCASEQLFAAAQTSSPLYTGSTALAEGYNSARPFPSLSRVDGGYFDLLGLDLWKFRFPTSTAVFSGYRGAALVASKTIVYDDDAGIHTFDFEGFTNLTEVRWKFSSQSRSLQMDNVRLFVRPGEPPVPQVEITSVNSIALLRLVFVRVGQRYTLQSSSDLQSWTDHSSFLALSAVISTGIGPVPWPPSHQFYRLRDGN